MIVPISISVPAVVSGIAIASIVRSDTGQAPPGATLPVNLVAGPESGGIYPWSGNFTDTSAATPTYYVLNGTVGGTAFPPFNIFGTTPPSGLWATAAMVQSIYSSDNVGLWDTSRNASGPDPSMFQGAFNRADTDIMSRLTRNYFVPPAPGFASYPELGWIEAEVTGAYLYLANGLQDSAKGMDGKIQVHLDYAWGQLDELMFLNRGGFQRVAGYQDAPVHGVQTVDPSGNWIDPYPPYPVPRWTGYRYLWQSGGAYFGCQGGGVNWSANAVAG